MPFVLEAPRVTPKRTNLLCAPGEWSAGATLSSPNASEPGTLVTDLLRIQPGDFWGQASPVVLRADRGSRQPLGVVFCGYCRVPRLATWRVRLGDSLFESEGLHLFDASGHGNHGTLAGGATFAPGLFSGGLALEGIDEQYVVAAASGSLSLAHGTWEVVGRWPQRAQWLLYQDAGAGVARGLYRDADGFVHVYRGSPTPLLSSSVPIPPGGAFHHVAYRFDDTASGELAVLIDGDEVATGNGFADAASGSFYVGGGGANDLVPSARGTFDEIRVSPTQLDTATIHARGTRELTDAEAATYALYYRCNGYDSGTLPFPAPGVIDFTELPDPRCHAFHFLPQEWTVRHQRIDVTSPTVGEILTFGVLLGGQGYQPENFSADMGRRFGIVDENQFDRGPGGVQTVEPGGHFNATEFLIDAISQQEMYAMWYRLQALFAGGRPGLVCLNPDDPVYLQHKLYYGVPRFELFTERSWDRHAISVRVEGMP